MSEPRRQPSMPRVLWLERDRVPPPPLPPAAPEPPPLFRPKSAVREKLFPTARPIARAIFRTMRTDGTGMRIVHRLEEPHVPAPRLLPPLVVAPRRAAEAEGGRDWLRVAPRRRPAGVPIGTILATVAAHYGIEVEEILAHRRTAHLVIPRQVAMYLAKALTARSLPDLGQRFGGRDHTTILHGVRRIAALMQADEALAGEVAELTARLKQGTPS